MKSYINNIIPRLNKFSKTLEKKELFVDKSWVLIDDKNNLQKYIFRRNGELIMSLNGSVKIGKWEYIIEANSLLIDRIEDKILLNHSFIDSAVMILKKDGTENNLIVLANDKIIVDLDVPKYLKELYRSKNNVSIVILKSGIELELLNSDVVVIGCKVTIDGNNIENNIFENENSIFKYIVKNSYVEKIIEKKTYNTKAGELLIECERDYYPQKGDLAFLNGIPANGKFKLTFLQYIYVNNGIIYKTSLF
ncbi:hypothetical protein ABGT15_13800 [Flavobacterium enshiense]|uniref:hypothetical protein n=1 Tax=Flavobacterium enshiense TaxID=1341165 RepID=UPI00345D5F09